MSISIILLFLAAFWILGRSLSGQGAFGPLKIADYARNAGFTGTDLVTAVAIAYAESSGNPDARGDETVQGDPSTATSYGLWQIHWTVHPEVGPKENLFDPQVNANAAYKVFQEQGFNAWSTYGNAPGHNNAYLNFLDQANQEVAA